MATANVPTYRLMNGWDLIAGLKQKKVNELLQKHPDFPYSGIKKVEVLGSQVDCKIDVIFHAPSITVRSGAGRLVDVTFPISGSVTIGENRIEIPDMPKPQSLIATVQLTQIEADSQEKKGENKTKFDFVLDLKSRDYIVDLKYEGLNAAELPIFTKILKNVLQEDVANKQNFKIYSVYLKNDFSTKYDAFIPHLADFTFVRDINNVDNSNILILMLTVNTKRGNIFFDQPILKDSVAAHSVLMIDNHLFLHQLVYPEVVANIKKDAKNKAEVENKIIISANDSKNELYTIHNNGNIELEQDSNPWISTFTCKVDQSVAELYLYLDVKAVKDASFFTIHVNTWVKTWFKMQTDGDKITIEKAKEDAGRSSDAPSWLKSIVDSKIPTLAGKFDSISKTTVEWAFQKEVAIIDVSLPGHLVLALDIKV